MPGGLQRLTSWLGGRGPGRTGTADRDAAAALAVAAAGQGDGPLARSLTAEMKDFMSAGGPLSRTVTAEMRDILASAGGAGGGLARTGTVDMVSAEAAVAELEAEARSLFKHMSIGALVKGWGQRASGGRRGACMGCGEACSTSLAHCAALPPTCHHHADEDGGVAAAAYAKELDLLPTIHAGGSSELEAASAAHSHAHSQRGSLLSSDPEPPSQESSLR